MQLKISITGLRLVSTELCFHVCVCICVCVCSIFSDGNQDISLLIWSSLEKSTDWNDMLLTKWNKKYGYTRKTSLVWFGCRPQMHGHWKKKKVKNRNFSLLRQMAKHHLLPRLCFSVLLMILVCPTQQQHLTVLLSCCINTVLAPQSLSLSLSSLYAQFFSWKNKHYCVLLTQSDERVIAERFTSAEPLNKY